MNVQGKKDGMKRDVPQRLIRRRNKKASFLSKPLIASV